MTEDRVEVIQKNISIVTGRISQAAHRAERDAGVVRLMAVTKTHPEAAVRAALASGIVLFGENRVQEAVSKYEGLTDRLELHLIGHLQRNKAKLAARFFKWVESIDKIETAIALDRAASEAGIKLNVLIEVNTSGEESKFGLRGQESLFRLIEAVVDLENLTVRGLMTVGPFTSDQHRIRSAFSELRNLYEAAGREFSLQPWDTLSMGMSNDYEIAVEEGATLVRIGTALFGSRGP